MQVHRQTAASVVQHMALGVAGLGCEDALTHLLNYVWPNIFETSPHVVNAVMGAVDGCRLALGPAVVLNYLLQVCRLLCLAHLLAALFTYVTSFKPVVRRHLPLRGSPSGSAVCCLVRAENVC